MRLLTMAVLMAALATNAYATSTTAPQPAPQPKPAGAPLVMNQIAYDDREFKAYAVRGTASIDGEASTTNAKGEKQPIVNATVYLTPNTRYTADLYLAQHYMSSTFPYDSRLKQHVWKAFTDARGQFAFTGLPKGAYFMELAIRDPNSPRWAPKYNVVVKNVALGDGEKATIDIGK